MAKNDQSFYEKKSRKLLKYNAYDAAFTARIYEKMINEERWSEPRVQRLHDIHVKLSKLCASMHTEGLKVHEENRARMIEDFERIYLRKEAKFIERVGIQAMRCTPGDLRALIYKRHETKAIHRFSLPDPFDPKMYTDDTLETISVDSACLKLLIAEGDIPDELKKIITLYWAAESAWKSRTFLVSTKTEHAIGPDRYLRPGWNSCGTGTMRFSCRDPNVMQWDKVLLSMFGCEDGEILVGLDKSQLEIRVVEIVSCDDYLWKLIQTGDVYSADVREALGLDPRVIIKKDDYKLATPRERRISDRLAKDYTIDELDEARHEFKINRLSCQYQSGLNGVYAQWLEAVPGVEFLTVKSHFDRFHRVHADGIDAYAKDELTRTASIGYSEGRVLQGRIYYPKPPPITEACNWPIQRTASEMMNLETLAYWKRIKKEVKSARIVYQKHDSVVTRCREKDEEKVKRIKSDMFNTEYTIGNRTRPFPVKIKSGRTLGKV